jgi:murein tripeptide amidase MpaA
VQILSAFDGGNIRVLDAAEPEDIRLEIQPDGSAPPYQWFYFRLVGAKGKACRMNIMNAGGAYVGGWEDYRAVVSCDRKVWRRVDTRYHSGVLTISFAPESNSVDVAYFAPYSMERHADLIARSLGTGLADLEYLGQTLDGQNLDLLTVGAPSDRKLVVWVTARQHPGETMAEWWMEGFLERLLDASDLVASQLRDEAVVYVVPNMNPDGSRRGHHRTNAAGTDLNRAWASPSIETSPEVHLVWTRMRETGPDLSLDVHGTEDTPHAFIIGPEGPAGYVQPVAGLVAEYKEALLRASPDFQVEKGFPVPRPEDANLAIGTNHQGETLKSVCMTLEMPFKDTSHTPDLALGWSPERSKQMGRDNVTAMAAIAASLRRERDAWR